MKKLLAVLLTLALALSMVTVAVAGTGGVELRGNGNNARIYFDGVRLSDTRPTNNTTTTFALPCGGTLAVTVQGNSIRNYTITPAVAAPVQEAAPAAPAVPAVPSINGGSGNAPNHSSGGLGVQRIDTVEIRGNGNSARIYLDGVQVPNSRPANNTLNVFTAACGAVVEVFVRGNAILTATVTRAAVEPTPEPVPYVTGTRYFYRPTASVPQASKYLATFEYENGTRYLADRSVNIVTGVENFTHTAFEATGTGIIAGFRATGTLEFQNVSQYRERFMPMHERVNIDIWSDGTETVASVEAPVQNGDVYYGKTYTTKPVDATRPIDVLSYAVGLVRGHGQVPAGSSGIYVRSYTFNFGGFTAEVYNDGNRGVLRSYKLVDISAL